MFPVLFAFGLTSIITVAVRTIAWRFQVVDIADGGRKRHARAVALWGGVALWAGVWGTVWYLFFTTSLFLPRFSGQQFLLISAASFLLIILGCLDDVLRLSPWTRLLCTGGVALITAIFGVTLHGITNPFGGIISLNQGLFFGISITSVLIIFLWLMGMMYTTKILDGVDGLTTTTTLIGTVIIFLLATLPRLWQSEVQTLALVLAGSCLGFLLFNLYPATIFLGEGGSLFLGFMLGVLAVIAGGKIATALLVMAMPILDLMFVLVRRYRHGRPLAEGDREHLHFRLIDRGWSSNQVVIFFAAVALLFGITTLFLPSIWKLILLGLLTIGVIALDRYLVRTKK